MFFWNSLNITRLNFSWRWLFVAFLFFVSSCSKVSLKEPLIFTVEGFENKSEGGKCALTYADGWKIEQLHWFVSNLHIKVDGKWHLKAFEVNPWQHKNVALITLATPDCSAESLRNQVSFEQAIDWQSVQAIKFDLGVPFTLNHLNPLQQPSPLNLPNMFWSWQMGHKFLRLDMQSPQRSWSFHLGSVGCAAASRVRSPQEPCQQPNLYTVELPLSGGNKLELNLSRLLQGLDIEKAPGCMFHGHGKDSCEQLLNNIQSGIFE